MNTNLARRIDVIKTETGLDEAALLAEAMRRGIDMLYQEQMIAKYLRGEVKRASLVKLIGVAAVKKIDDQKRAIDEDFAWGTTG